MKTYYECGICGAMHNASWNGDCREAGAGFQLEELPAGFLEIGMEEVDEWQEKEEIRKAVKAGRRALNGNSNDAEHDALYALVQLLEESQP